MIELYHDLLIVHPFLMSAVVTKVHISKELIGMTMTCRFDYFFSASERIEVEVYRVISVLSFTVG